MDYKPKHQTKNYETSRIKWEKNICELKYFSDTTQEEHNLFQRHH